MKSSLFLNEMLTKGAILGVVLLASNITETAMIAYGKSPVWMNILGVEIVVFSIISIYLLYRFTRNYANMVLAERKDISFFSYGNGLSYVLCLTLLSGIIVSLGGYLFRHYIVGHETYINGYISLVQNSLTTTEMPANVAGSFDELFKLVQNQDEPTLIQTVLSGIWGSLFKGLFLGLIIAAFTKREPVIFENDGE